MNVTENELCLSSTSCGGGGATSFGGGVRGVRNGAAQVGLLEQVQHEDVAEGSEADAPQEAPFRCQVDNNSDDGRDNRRPPLRACDARVITERRQDEDQQNPRRHPHGHIPNEA